MITRQTIESNFSQFDPKAPDQLNIADMISDTISSEPMFFAWITVMFKQMEFKDSLSAAITVISLYEMLKKSQESSDKLRKETDGS